MMTKKTITKPMLKSIDARKLSHVVGGDAPQPLPWITRQPVARPDDNSTPLPW